MVDILKEHIAVAEAKKLNIPTFAIVDTNSDPRQVDFAIPANDDASKSIFLIIESMVNAIEEGLVERKLDRDKKAADEEREGRTEGTEDEFGVRTSIDALDLDEEEEGIKITKKDFVETKVAKLKTISEEEKEKAKTPRKRINKPVGKSNKK